VTSKEIIGKVIRLEKTPRVPVSLLSGGAWNLNRVGLTLEQALAEKHIRPLKFIMWLPGRRPSRRFDSASVTSGPRHAKAPGTAFGGLFMEWRGCDDLSSYTQAVN